MSEIHCLYVRLPNWVGDVCMSLPALRLLQASGAPLVLCARPWAYDLLSGVSKQDFIALSGKFRSDYAAIRAHARQVGRFNAQRRGLLLPDSLSSALLFRLAGIPSAGYRDDGRGPFLRWPISKPEQAPLHAVQSWYALTRTALGHWGLPAAPNEPQRTLDLPLTTAHQTQADQALALAGLTHQRYVLIAPTATGLHHGKVKVWSGFDFLTRTLQDHGYTVIMCPPAAETDAARRNAPTAQLLAPLSLGAFAALTARAALVICNDSGVSHIAASVAARQITLFGVTQPERTGPWSPNACAIGHAGAWPALDEVVQQALQQLGNLA